jgi:hypothetical protein
LRLKADTKPAPQAAGIRTVTVTAAPLERTLRVSGATSARNFANVSAPTMRGPDAGRALILIELAKSGSRIRKGEVVAQIDAQAIKDHLEDVLSQLVQAESDIRKRKAELEIEMETLRQNVRVAKANLDKARLDAQASEIRTSIDRELLQLAIEEADAQYQQLQRDLVTTKERQRADLRLTELERDSQARHRDRHVTDVQRFTIRAAMDGLVVMQSIWRSGDLGQVQLGDQVAPGQPFAKIVDTSSMQVEGAVNQTESESIRLGQRATVALDAFPGLVLQGKVTAVGALAVGGWRQNYYIRNVPVRVAIESRDARLIPDLSSSADIVLSQQAEAVLAPREAIRTVGGKTLVYVKRAGQFQAREVELGEATNTQVAIVRGLAAGEEIAAQAYAVAR